jgi:hypothetical protein
MTEILFFTCWICMFDDVVYYCNYFCTLLYLIHCMFKNFIFQTVNWSMVMYLLSHWCIKFCSLIRQWINVVHITPFVTKHQLLIGELWVQSHMSWCDSYGGQSDTRAQFFWSLYGCPPLIIIAPLLRMSVAASFGWTVGLISLLSVISCSLRVSSF